MRDGKPHQVSGPEHDILNALILGSWSFSEYWDEDSEPYYHYGYDATESIEGLLVIYQDRLRTKDGKIVVLIQLVWRIGSPGYAFRVAPDTRLRNPSHNSLPGAE